MATHVTGEQDRSSPALPDVLPVDVTAHTRLSWELGTSVVDGADVERVGAWEQTDALWDLVVFRATTSTVVLRVRTPIGRERFFEAPRSDFESGRSRLEASARWQRVD